MNIIEFDVTQHCTIFYQRDLLQDKVRMQLSFYYQIPQSFLYFFALQLLGLTNHWAS